MLQAQLEEETKVKEVQENQVLANQINRSIALVGLGPHARRIYMHYFKKYGFSPKLIIELESKKEEVENYLTSNELIVDTIYVNDDLKNEEVLALNTQLQLQKLIKKHKITHAIISTEPKAHFSYSRFFLENNISTLIDKPITSPVNVSNEPIMAQKIEEDYNHLLGLYENMEQKCQVQCQRRWHPGYAFIRETMEKVILQYGIPVTSIDVYHCDGMWNMPDEFIFRENHPYKYGYGKLFHSGYHFIDLACWLLDLNNLLPQKRPDNVELYSNAIRPNHFFEVINKEDYQRIFQTSKFDEVIENKESHPFEEYGEIDFYSLMQFKKGETPIATCTLNLLQSGFSRRSWTELPEDTYKGNGRVRHERVNIQIGPLMNIQVHSYQSKEIKERGTDTQDEVGALEHFDIYIFRNTDLIGGIPFEKVSLSDLSEKDETGNFIGYNEQARESCLIEFLKGDNCTSEITDHKTTIKVLSNAYLSLCQRKEKQNPIVNFSI